MLSSLPFQQLTWKKDMCCASSVITQSRKPSWRNSHQNGIYLWSLFCVSVCVQAKHVGVVHNGIIKVSGVKECHLYNPILINKKIRRFQITMHYYWCAIVQVIHSPSLPVQPKKENFNTGKASVCMLSKNWKSIESKKTGAYSIKSHP